MEKKYEKIAKTPYQRALEHAQVSEEVKEKIRQEHALFNPSVMTKEIDRLKAVLYALQRKHGQPKNQEKPPSTRGSVG